jgi:UPF0716 protein FxsA
MGKLLLLFICVPAVELALLIEIGARIGTAATIALIIVTGILGANLARRQGLRVIAEIQADMGRGELPTGQLLDGLMIIVASALLVTPGVLTDVFGFLCLTPWFREQIKSAIQQRLERAVAENHVHISVNPLGPTGPPSWPSERREPIDVTPRGTHTSTPHRPEDER